MYQRAKLADLVKRKAKKEDASVGKVLPPLPPIQPGEDDYAKSVERKRSNDTVESLSDATVEPEVEPETLSSDAEDSCSSGSTDGQEQEPEAIVMFEIGRRIIRLYLCEKHFCEAYMGHFEYIGRSVQYDGVKATQRLLETGFMELFRQMLTRFLSRLVTAADFKSVNARLPLILFNINTVTTMTDRSEEACRKVIQIELYTDVINLLKSVQLSNLGIFELGLNVVGVLYNVVQVIPEARELFREQGIIEVLQRFRTGTTNPLSCLALVVLAWVINDDENSILNSSDEAFSYLNEQLKSSLDEDSHRSDGGYKAVEILRAINKLIVNDANKKQFINIGILSSYAMFLEPQFDAEEQFLAVQGLWTLSFKYAEKIKMEKICVERLESLLKMSEHNRVRGQINGVLITLGIKQESTIRTSSKLSPTEGLSSELEEKGKRIFISYQRSWKETVLKIRDRLRDHGYIVWMDVDNICESVAEDIANGLDTSSTVLVCLSQNYYESPWCNKEVNYANTTNKEIIPLILEPKYKPHGWLGLLIAGNVWIDFSQAQSFDASLRTLLNRINKSLDEVDTGRRNKQTKVSSHVPTVDKDQNDSVTTNEPEVVQKESHSVSHSASTTAGVYSWTKTDVREWLEKNNFQHLTKWFSDYDGRLLLEFHHVLEKFPELVAQRFIAAHSVKDFLQLKMDLRSLP